MAEAAIEFEIGSIKFKATGDQKWVSDQLLKVVDSAENLLKLAPVTTQSQGGAGRESGSKSAQTGEFTTSLAAHIRDKGGETNQRTRFLATADWLRLRGTAGLTTAMVTKALKDNHQKKLANPSETLNQNVKAGLCEKTSGGFFITPDGLKSLGHN